jgi:hypothetical protein
MIKNDRWNTIDGAPEVAPAHDPTPSLLQLEKMQRLRIQGYTEEKAERLCKPKEVDMDEVMERIMVCQERELRRLAKLNPKKKPVKPRKTDDFPDLTEIKISAVDLRPDLKWMTTT